ncbi:MAG: hypothetical protein WBA39_00550 [Rivularia sp. (in: cyanobacteria)]
MKRFELGCSGRLPSVELRLTLTRLIMTTFLIGVAMVGKVITGFNVFNQSQIMLLKWDCCLSSIETDTRKVLR